MIRIIIVEDESPIARGLSLLISQNHPGFEVVAICHNGKEGLEKILDQKPDLVFADINMPIMSGLDMIGQMQEAGFHTRCIILTGYADFEYARTAIHLGVSDYLLKPISLNALDEIMVSCREQHLSTIRILQAEYLQRHLLSRQGALENSNPLLHYSCTLFVLFFGSMCGNIYNEAMFDTEIKLADNNLRSGIEAQYHLSLLVLRGHYHNESVYAAVYPTHQSVDLDLVAKELYQSFRQSDTYLHLIISDTVTDGEGIYRAARDTYLFALFHNQFGFGSIKQYKPLQNQPIRVSKEILRICASIPRPLSYDTLRRFIHSMFFYWQQERTTQFQLVADLRYFSNIVIRDYTEENLFCQDVEEMVSSCHSYKELENEILDELEQAYGFERGFPDERQQSLARQVRNWLDKNFTTQISYKIFQDIFGYNEKYISALFKAEFGMSPSKYIGELRLNLAKKLMQGNPDILLKDVAEIAGFSDAFYFSRVFKSHEGISPSLYIKQLRP